MTAYLCQHKPTSHGSRKLQQGSRCLCRFHSGAASGRLKACLIAMILSCHDSVALGCGSAALCPPCLCGSIPFPLKRDKTLLPQRHRGHGGQSKKSAKRSLHCNPRTCSQAARIFSERGRSPSAAARSPGDWRKVRDALLFARAADGDRPRSGFAARRAVSFAPLR